MKSVKNVAKLMMKENENLHINESVEIKVLYVWNGQNIKIIIARV